MWITIRQILLSSPRQQASAPPLIVSSALCLAEEILNHGVAAHQGYTKCQPFISADPTLIPLFEICPIFSLVLPDSTIHPHNRSNLEWPIYLPIRRWEETENPA